MRPRCTAFAIISTPAVPQTRRATTEASIPKLPPVSHSEPCSWNDSTRQCVEVVSRDTWVSYVGEASATACRK